ncbi:hypothetical protein TA3x_004150 [Tundrisphaera sp. TA3]|uniref:hypothetical protein n=1 Tax=Tundrisphaera sp. TA3 TaxID=3435775 RepID=UPI003EBAB4F1
MSKRNKNRPAKGGAPLAPIPTPLDPEALRRRRRRRWIFLLSILVAAPIVEAIAYQFRSITVALVNRTEMPLHGIRIEFPGGVVERAELAPGAADVHQIRPDFSFSLADFSSYRTMIRFGTGAGMLSRHNIKITSIDYSSRETYTIRPGPPGMPLVLDHTTEPGFPLGQIRDLFRSLGLR